MKILYSNFYYRQIVGLLTKICYTACSLNSSSEKLNKFLSSFRPLKYKKGEVILRGGETPQGICFVKSGFVKLSSISSDGDELTLVIYKEGEFFPVVWSFFGGTRGSIYSFETLTQAEIAKVPRQIFLDFISANQDVFMDITKHIITRFQSALRRMEFLTFGNAKAKIVSMILILGKDFGFLKAKGIEIQIPLTHKDIANLAGLTRETVSIELKKLSRRGYLAYDSKVIVIKNKRALEKEAVLS